MKVLKFIDNFFFELHEDEGTTEYSVWSKLWFYIPLGVVLIFFIWTVISWMF